MDPFELLPAVVSTYGGWHPSFVRWFRRLTLVAAESVHGSQAREVRRHLLWRAVGHLSIQVQRDTFAALSRGLSPLEQGLVGTQGRVLSEDPEFWRAAPAAAVERLDDFAGDLP